jgi:hypothetical protein
MIRLLRFLSERQHFRVRTGQLFKPIRAIENWDFEVELEYNASSNIREYVETVVGKPEHEYPS